MGSFPKKFSIQSSRESTGLFFSEVPVEPNVNKYCVVCKETEAKLKAVGNGDHMCPTCLASYPELKAKKEPKEKAEDDRE